MICVIYRVLGGGTGGVGDCHGRELGVFLTRFEAEAYAKDKGDWGGDAKIHDIPTIKLNGQYYELAQREPLKIKEAL